MISHSDIFYFYDEVQYTKNDWRNRNKIIEGGTPAWLTIPISYSFTAKKSINEIQLPNSNWRENHLSRIRNSYQTTKYFNEYFNHLSTVLDQSFIGLSELNQEIITHVMHEIGIITELRNSTPSKNPRTKSEKLLDICIEAGATTYLTTPKALDYLDVDLFKRSRIAVEILDFESCLPEYSQKSEIFSPFVSYLDLLFNTGKEEFLRRIGT